MEVQRIADILSPQSVMVLSEPASSESAIRALVEVISGEPAAKAGLLAAVLEREKVGSTGMGNGVAIPHARCPGLKAPRLAAALARPPIDFKAADGRPVAMIFLLAVPESAPNSHLKALAALSRIALEQKLLRRLIKAATPKELYDLLAERPFDTPR